jgi:hypothetical protein
VEQCRETNAENNGEDRVNRPALCIVMLVAALSVPHAAALDLPTLDKISVMMSRDQVRYIAGPPDAAAALAADLTLETWKMTGAPGMVAAGGIFDARGALIAQAYVFAGEAGLVALDSLRGFGFKVVEGQDGVTRLYGADDDTGRPLVVIIDAGPDLTTVFAYEQREYEKRLAMGPLPSGPGMPVAVTPSASSTPRPANTMDPAVAAALANGVGLMFGNMKPMQASKTLSSSSSVTRNPDGSVTTRSSSTSVSVSVDPAGVANALTTLMTKQ